MKAIYALMFAMILCLPMAFAMDAELLNTDPYPLEAGEQGDIRVKVFEHPPRENSGESAELVNVTVQFIGSEAITLLDETKRTKTHTMQSRHSPAYFQLADYPVHIADDAPEGKIPLKLRLSTGSSDTRTVTIDIPVTRDDANLSLGNIKSTPNDLYPDTEDIRIDLQVANIGELRAENVVMQVDSTTLRPASSFAMRYGLGTIGEGETQTAQLHARIPENTTPGTHTMRIKLRYTEEDSQEATRQSFSVPFSVLGKPRFELTTLNNEVTKQGESSHLKLSIKNTGTKKAERVAVDVVKNSDTQIEFESYTDFVGDLEPGENGEIYLPYTVGDKATVKEHQITLSVRYLFNDKVQTEDVRQTLTVEESRDSLMENRTFVIIAIAAIVLIAVAIKTVMDIRHDKQGNG